MGSKPRDPSLPPREANEQNLDWEGRKGEEHADLISWQLLDQEAATGLAWALPEGDLTPLLGARHAGT